MEAFLKNIAASSEVVLDANKLAIDNSNSVKRHLLISPRDMAIEVSGQDRVAEVVVFHGNGGRANLEFSVQRGAKLNVVELVASPSSSVATYNIGGDVSCNITLVRLVGGKTTHDVALNGEGSKVVINAVQLAEDGECLEYDSNMRHMLAHCDSNTLVKSVAAGCSKIEFRGLVYVAQDAQQTNAEQSCRNIEMDNKSKISVEPQLEIYADDVKCSHGATVGQLNGDAIWYMRQRGLTKAQAQRLQLEGFAMDVISKCPVVELVEGLGELVEAKLLKM